MRQLVTSWSVVSGVGEWARIRPLYSASSSIEKTTVLALELYLVGVGENSTAALDPEPPARPPHFDRTRGLSSLPLPLPRREAARRRQRPPLAFFPYRPSLPPSLPPLLPRARAVPSLYFPLPLFQPLVAQPSPSLSPSFLYPEWRGA